MTSTQEQPAVSTPQRSRLRVSLPKWKKGRDAGSKMFVRRVKDTKAFTSSISVHKEKVAAGLEKRLAPALRNDGEAIPDHAMTLELVGRTVEAALEDLRKAHRDYVDQTNLCNGLSRECDRLAKKEVYPRAVSLRRILEATFGKNESTVIHAFRGRIPTWRDGLLEQVGCTLNLLQAPQRSLPAAKIRGAAIDRQDWIELIEAPYEKLAERLLDLENQDRQREYLGEVRRQAMKAFDETLRDSRGVAAALFTMAGCHPRFIKNLRAYYERRWMSHSARQRREERKEKRQQTVAGSDTTTGSGSNDNAPPKAKPYSKVSTWLASHFKSA